MRTARQVGSRAAQRGEALLILSDGSWGRSCTTAGAVPHFPNTDTEQSDAGALAVLQQVPSVVLEFPGQVDLRGLLLIARVPAVLVGHVVEGGVPLRAFEILVGLGPVEVVAIPHVVVLPPRLPQVADGGDERWGALAQVDGLLVHATPLKPRHGQWVLRAIGWAHTCLWPELMLFLWSSQPWLHRAQGWVLSFAVMRSSHSGMAVTVRVEVVGVCGVHALPAPADPGVWSHARVPVRGELHVGRGERVEHGLVERLAPADLSAQAGPDRP